MPPKKAKTRSSTVEPVKDVSPSKKDAD
jgi:poly [ADP-ribose] polymerase 2/3/4